MDSFDLQIRSLVKCLSAQKIKYVIIGGIAVSIYGMPRLTLDIDVNIILDKEKINEFLQRAKKYGLYPAPPNSKKIAQTTGVIPLKFKKQKVFGQVDIIIAENLLEYSAIERGRIKKIGSIMVRVISPEDLVIHKIASLRARDREDLQGILMRQRQRLNLGYIRGCLKKIDKANRGSGLYKLFCRLLEELRVKT